VRSHINRSVPPATFQTTVVVLVYSRPDYDNAVLVGLPVYLQRCLQSALNAANKRQFINLLCYQFVTKSVSLER